MCVGTNTPTAVIYPSRPACHAGAFILNSGLRRTRRGTYEPGVSDAAAVANAAGDTGSPPAKGVTLEQEGFIHCSLSH